MSFISPGRVRGGRGHKRSAFEDTKTIKRHFILKHKKTQILVGEIGAKNRMAN